jgi:hypothetical protein
MSDAPERIWITQTPYGWTLEEPGGNWATEEYVRADLVPAQPSQAPVCPVCHREVTGYRCQCGTGAQPSQAQQAGVTEAMVEAAKEVFYLNRNYGGPRERVRAALTAALSARQGDGA